MRCPNCNGAMEMNRYEPGKWKSFQCNRCRYSKKKHESGYSGQLVINSRVPIRHQERE